MHFIFASIYEGFRCLLTCFQLFYERGISRKTLSALLNGRSDISSEMALRLSKVFGRTPEGWLKLQIQYDLWKMQKDLDLSQLKRIAAASDQAC